jgi:hypothetical protein
MHQHVQSNLAKGLPTAQAVMQEPPVVLACPCNHAPLLKMVANICCWSLFLSTLDTSGVRNRKTCVWTQGLAWLLADHSCALLCCPATSQAPAAPAQSESPASLPLLPYLLRDCCLLVPRTCLITDLEALRERARSALVGSSNEPIGALYHHVESPVPLLSQATLPVHSAHTSCSHCLSCQDPKTRHRYNPAGII